MMHGRRVTAIILAVVGACAAVLGIVLAVADRSLFDEGQVEETTRTVVEDRDVKRLLVREVTNRVVEVGDLEEQREETAAIVSVILADPRVEVLVTRGVMVSYDSLVNGADEVIDFNLVSLADEVRGQAVRALPALDDRLPPADDLLRWELFRRADLPELFDVIDTVRLAAWWVLVGGLLCVGAAIVLGPGRFGIFAIAAGVGVVAMFLAATWISTASDGAVDGIEDDLTRRVARVATDEYLADLNHVVVAVVIFGIIGVIAGIGGSWIRNAVLPPRPHVVKTK